MSGCLDDMVNEENRTNVFSLVHSLPWSETTSTLVASTFLLFFLWMFWSLPMVKDLNIDETGGGAIKNSR